jgi:hypothetical protein
VGLQTGDSSPKEMLVWHEPYSPWRLHAVDLNGSPGWTHTGNDPRASGHRIDDGSSIMPRLIFVLFLLATISLTAPRLLLQPFATAKRSDITD